MRQKYPIWGNDGIFKFKCKVPSYISSDFVSWIDTDEQRNRGEFNSKYLNFLFAAVSQNYNTRVSPEDVILGNDAIMKCRIPSFVSDFVTVQDWKDSEGLILFPDSNYGTNNPDIQ